MNKALSWKLGGAGPDAREAAREAARRQGKSLGEWLHGVIADEAADHAEPIQDAPSHDRIGTLTTRLERIGARPSDAEGQSREQADRRMTSGAGRRPSLGDDMAEDRRRPIADPVQIGGADARLEQAIGAMERSAQRSERRAEDALDTLVKMLETSERRRERERAGIADLTRKLAAIDSRMSAPDESPIQDTLARLEARLEQIGRRSEAEANARRNALTADAGDAAEPMRRLEEKLNAVLQAVASGPHPAPANISPIALAAARGEIGARPVEIPLRRRRLGEAIADIAGRQRMLDGAGVPDAGDIAASDTGAIATSAVGDALAAHVEGLRRELDRGTPARASDRFDFEALRSDINAMAEQLRGLAPRGAVTAIESQISRIESRLAAASGDESSVTIDGLKADMREMGGRLDTIARSVTPIETTARLQSQIEEMRDQLTNGLAQKRGQSGSTLETLVDELGRRIEAVQAPDAGAPAIDALQRQVGMLASRLESTETGLASLATIERSMRDLFAHLETRSFAESASARGAHEANRAPAARPDIAARKAMQEDADLRTRATLDVMHETLDKMVDRLAAVEQDVVTTPSPRAAQLSSKDADQPERRVGAEGISLGAAEPILTPRFDGKPTRKRPAAPVGASERTVHDVGSGKADFIAAARRAAHAAQSDSSLAALRAPATEGPGAARAGLLAKSRDYVASHKRPVLLALAAVLVVATTMALVQRIPLGSSDQQIAERAAPTKVAMDRAAPSTATGAQLDAMTPSALPRSKPALVAQIPGSDPIATGSIPSLPAFAAGTPPGVPHKPTLPAGLARMAEAGDGPAEYTLATAYAEGRGAPRDFPHAAKLYAEAAGKGIVPAQYRLGALYEKGLGVAQDKARAKALYQQAADAGNPRAMHNLAVLLADGDGKPDYEGAATWFRKAAQYGVRDSQFNLAILLARGLGVDQSLVQSYQWFAIAAAQGDSDAASKRDEVGNKLAASELSIAKALAAAFHPRSVDPAAVEVDAPPGGWDGDSSSVHLNSGKSKIS